MNSTPSSTTGSAAKKDVQKLQRAIIDGLEDVKAVDIQVFDTEHITSLFERVQTKALAASVRDAVRDAGFAKPRIEGEENGEWIIVDCGAAVAHIMQPTIRTYYHLEEIWGDKPVRLKFGATKPAVATEKPEPKALTKKEVAAKTSIRRSSAAKTAVKAAEQAEKEAKFLEAAEVARSARKRAPARGRVASARTSAKVPSRAPTSRAPIQSAGKTVSKAPAKSVVKPATKIKTVVVGAPAKKPAAKRAASSAPLKRAPGRK